MDDEQLKKQHVSIVICGHVDSGKSTTTGRLIYELGGLDERTMQKLTEEAERAGRGSFKFAFFMDTTPEERDRGVTIQCQTKEFFTKKYHYTLIDAPGHRDFIKNMITGTSQADVAVLMVPADGNFVTAIQKGDRKAMQVQGQTRQHALLINLLGVKQLIVCVNKMDERTANYSEERFIEIKTEIQRMLVSVGWNQAQVNQRIPVLPISGWVGDNLINKSENMPWWKGTKVLRGAKGKEETLDIVTLEDALESVRLPPRPVDKPFRMPISGVMNIKGVGTVITGRIEQGVLRKDQMLKFLPTHTGTNKCVGKVFSMEMHHKNVKESGPGDNVGVNIKGLEKGNMPKKGDVAVFLNDSTIATHKRIHATIQTLDIPNAIKINYTPLGFVRTASAPLKLVDIVRIKNKASGGEWVEGHKELVSNTFAEVVFEAQKPFCCDSFKNCEGLSRLALMEGHSCAALGKITKVD
jgi:elongation factor 1-alpha